MDCYQNFRATLAGKKWVLLFTAGFFILTGMSGDHVDFSGEWKLNESKSERTGSFPLCIFGGDRMRSKTMEITANPGFLSVATSSFTGGAVVTKQEKLVFDSKDIKVTYVGTPREQSAAKWSDDGQTMTVHSVRSLDTNGKTADFKVTEVWKLINGGNSIAIQVNVSSATGVFKMNLVYDRQTAADYRF